MGYILPTVLDQYTQYVNRTTMKKTSPLVVQPVFKSTLEKKLRGEEFEENDYTLSGDNEKNITEKKVQLKKEKSQIIISDLTGKGRLFNESI